MPGFVLTPDWIKTAKQLTADTGGDWQGYIDDIAARERADRPLRHRRRRWRTSSSSCARTRASYSVGSTYFVDGGMLKTV